MLSLSASVVSHLQPRVVAPPQPPRQPEYQREAVVGVSPGEGGILSSEVDASFWFSLANSAPLVQALVMARSPRTALVPPPAVLRAGAAYRPRTKLGGRLWELRSRLVASGAKLLDWEEIEREVAARRESARAGRV